MFFKLKIDGFSMSFSLI